MCFSNILFVYSWETHRERQRRRQREAGSLQGARCGTRSQGSRIMPWAEGRHSTTEPPRDPLFLLKIYLFIGTGGGCAEHRAQCGAWFPQPWDRDVSKTQSRCLTDWATHVPQNVFLTISSFLHLLAGIFFQIPSVLELDHCGFMSF